MNLLRRVDPALDQPENLVVERAALAHGRRRELLVERFGQPEAKLDDLPPLFLPGLMHGDSLALPLFACQYRHGIDSLVFGCYTNTVTPRARQVSP